MFEKKLRVFIKKSLTNQYAENLEDWPRFIHDDYKKPSPAELLKAKYQTGKHKINNLLLPDQSTRIGDYLKGFDIAGLGETYNHLGDKHSKDLLITNIATRMMGPEKVKMPLTKRKFWDQYFVVSAAKQKKQISSKYYKFNLYNLKSLGYNVKLFYDNLSIFINYGLRQYEYSRGNAVCKVVKGDYVIDGGTCFGDTALYFASQIGPKGKVFAFEFVPDNLKVMRVNLNLNPSLSKNIELIKRPLWSSSNKELFVVEHGPASMVFMKKPKSYDFKVPTQSIDDYVKDQKIKKVDFIKLDIEGAELETLKGAKRTIQEFHPKIAVCIYHDIDHFVSVPKYIRELVPDYDLFIDHYTIHLAETVLYAIPRSV